MTRSQEKYDCIIVGGGVLGAFHAYHAIEQGLRVAILEKDNEPRGATTQNFGQVVPSGLDSEWQKFGRESLEIYRSIQEKFDISVRQLGSIYIASDDDELILIEELHAINLRNGYSSELWTAQQCRLRYPQLRSDYCRGGLFFPDELSVNPRLMIHRLWRFLAQNPLIDLRFRTSATGVESSGGDSVLVKTSDGQRFNATKAIVCSGSDFRVLFPKIFRKSDLELVKLQMLRLSPQPNVEIPGNVLTGLSIRRYESFSQCPSWKEIKAREDDNDFAKKWGVHILFKQETDGGIILGDSHEYLKTADDDAFTHELHTDVNDFFVREAKRIFDLPNWNIVSAWAGFYCQTQDPSGIFCHAIDNRIHIVTGIGGKGMTSSAGFARHHLQQITF